jgi:hypothetical protein
MKVTSADGVKGTIIRTFDGKYFFRVYDEDHNFVDYSLIHSDLVVTITDVDAYFYSGGGIHRLDHSPKTLGSTGIYPDEG